MNYERIKEFALYAGYEPDMFGIGHWDSEEFRKYTELIVRECSNVILEWKAEPFPLDPDFAASLVREHFGVDK